MIFFTQLYYSAKRLLMDPKPILIRLLSFIIIILILGTAFSTSFDVSSLNKVKVAYLNEDSGQFGTMFISSLSQADEIKSLVNLEKVSSFNEGKDLITNQKADAFIDIPSGFSQQVGTTGKSSTVEVYLSKYSGLNTTVVKNVVDSLVNGMNTSVVTYKMAGSLQPDTSSSGTNLTEVPLSHAKSQTAMGYYAVAMLLMMMMYGAEYGRVGMGEDYVGVLGDRIKLSPMRPFEQYFGKLIGLSLVTCFQAFVIILFTKYVYGVDWGDNFAVIALIVFTFSVMTTTLGAMITILTNGAVKAGSIVSIITLASTFLAGGFVIVDFGILANLSPSYYAKTAIFNAVYNGDLHLTFLNVGEMWVITLLFAAISMVVAGRKRA